MPIYSYSCLRTIQYTYNYKIILLSVAVGFFLNPLKNREILETLLRDKRMRFDMENFLSLLDLLLFASLEVAEAVGADDRLNKRPKPENQLH